MVIFCALGMGEVGNILLGIIERFYATHSIYSSIAKFQTLCGKHINSWYFWNIVTPHKNSKMLSIT